MIYKMDAELTLEELGLFSIMSNIPEARSATAEHLSGYSEKDSFEKILRLLKSLVDKGYITYDGNKFTAIPEKAKEYIL